MKHVVEYKLHGGTIPYFIADGGYFFNNGKMIGVTKDDVMCYVPPNTVLVTFDTLNDLLDHLLPNDMVDIFQTPLTTEQKTDIITTWWNTHP